MVCNSKALEYLMRKHGLEANHDINFLNLIRVSMPGEGKRSRTGGKCTGVCTIAVLVFDRAVVIVS